MKKILALIMVALFSLVAFAGTTVFDAISLTTLTDGTLTITGGAISGIAELSFTGDLTVAGDFYITGDITQTGSTTITVDLAVGGTANLDNTDIDGTFTLDGTTAALTCNTSIISYTPSFVIGKDATDTMTIAVADSSGNVGITHAGGTKKVTWTTTGGFDFVGPIEVDALTAVGNMGITGTFATEGTTAVLDGSTHVKLLSDTLIDAECADIRLGINATEYMKLVTTVSSGNLAITHPLKTPDVTWTAASFDFTGDFTADGAAMVFDGSTTVDVLGATRIDIESPLIYLGRDVDDYMLLTTSDGTGNLAITHEGTPAVTWEAASFAFTGTFEVVGASTFAAITGVGNTDITGNLTVDGTALSLDGSTSVALISPSIRFGFSDSIYTSFAVATTTGNLTITHVGGGTDLVTWTAAGGFDFNGAFGADALTLTSVLTFSDDATIDNTDSTTLTLTETNIELVGIVAIVDDVDIGSSGNVGSLDLFPATSARGKLAFVAANSAGDTTTTITNASQADAWTYTIPDAGASGYFVMSQAAQNTEGQIDREDLSEDDLVICGVPLTNIVDHDGASMAAAAAAGRFGRISGGYGTGTLTLDGEAANTDSKTSTCMFEFILPPGYQASGDVNLVVTAYESVGAAFASTTLTAEVYENDGDGTVSSDLYNTFVPSDITDAWQTCTSVITDTGLIAGDRLIVFIQIVCNDTGGTTGTVAQIGKVEMRCDVKGS